MVNNISQPKNTCKNTAPPKTLYGKHPIYVNLLPPCNNACPAGENIQKWLSLVQNNKLQEAWETIIENNPMPSIHGRVCYHPCENNCNRRQLDATINIHAIERFLGDLAISEGWTIALPKQNSTKKILIIGAGPAGLSCAYHLKLLGHDVTIYEALAKAGGMMYVGIPSFRLPDNILASEVKRILDMGIKIEFNHCVDDVLAEKEKGKFDAVFLAVGAHKGKTVEVAVNDPCPIWDAIKFLKAVKANNVPQIGDHLVVFGGSNTAMDVARSAIRLGIKNVHIVYHRSRQRMAAFDFEIDETLDEGANLKVLRSLNKVDGNKIILNVVTLDDKGNPIPTGELEELPANMLVFALGQNSETDFLKKVYGIELKNNGSVIVDEQMMTGASGIFAGGDMLPYDQSVTYAVGHGKKAAKCIDAYLNGTSYANPKKHDIINYDNMDLWFDDPAMKTSQPLQEPTERVKSFAEVVGGFTKNETIHEAKRCLSCGNCFECDGCYGVCPENAIVKLGHGQKYRFDRDLCTGCQACYHECPCSAIEMEEDE